jgi:hypothetical protein
VYPAPEGSIVEFHPIKPPNFIKVVVACIGSQSINTHEEGTHEIISSVAATVLFASLAVHAQDTTKTTIKTEDGRVAR